MYTRELKVSFICSAILILKLILKEFFLNFLISRKFLSKTFLYIVFIIILFSKRF